MQTPADRSAESVTAEHSLNPQRAFVDGPNMRVLWVGMGAEYSVASLARSWREGRISPDEQFEFDGKRMSFRQLCLNESWLKSELGLLPDAKTPERRSWFAERKFRREAWRKVVENGELSSFSLVERIERLRQELDEARYKCHVAEDSLASAQDREKNLVAALRIGIEDSRELASILARMSAKEVLSRGKVDCTPAFQILGRLVGNLRDGFVEIVGASVQDLRNPDLNRIDQTVLFYKTSREEIEEARRVFAAEKKAWSEKLDQRKKEIQDSVREAKKYLNDEINKARCHLEALTRHYRQTAALFAKWRQAVEKIFFEKPFTGERCVIGKPASIPKDWVSRAIFSYAQMVSPEAILAMFKSGFLSGARFGLLVAWDGLHWKMAENEPAGFLPWGWRGKLTVKRGFFHGAKIGLNDGTKFGSLWCAGPEGEIEEFLVRVDEANDAIPRNHLPNDLSETFCKVSHFAQSIEELAARPIILNSR